ncbi:hypothetical protein BDY24DRAFT_402989 [Mrakia frigida]|uniref:uncharacterized protein n=1 Tax=Mrakia frigida TaxID=29902 RepID=UPI003FCC15A5
MTETAMTCTKCSSPSSMRCSRCNIENYCSSACQSAAWPAHKLLCRAPLPSTSRLWIIHPKRYAPAHSDEPFASRDSIKAHLQAWDMKDDVFGTESKEKEAIKKKFKWTGVDEGGKAYNKAGAISWYYYQYSSSSERVPTASTSSTTTNPIGSLFAYKGAVRRQPVILVKSGPGDMGDGQMDLEELVDTIWWYAKEGARQEAVFQHRESQRMFPRGVPAGFASHTSVFPNFSNKH